VETLKKYHIQTNNPELYERAFTHTSYANEMGTESYERLEYLGDAVLELFVSNYLYHKEDMEEGEMTKKRSHLVCENALFLYSTRLGLNDDLRLGKGELENGGKYRKAIVADIFESFLGALYLDKGYQEVSSFMETYIVPIMEDESLDFFDDYKSILQEQVQTDKRSLEYIVTKESGPAHHKTFTVIVKIDDMIYGEGVAHSKKEAENLAAKDALSKSCR